MALGIIPDSKQRHFPSRPGQTGSGLQSNKIILFKQLSGPLETNKTNKQTSSSDDVQPMKIKTTQSKVPVWRKKISGLQIFCLEKLGGRICRQEVASSAGLTNDFRVVPLIILAWATPPPPPPPGQRPTKQWRASLAAGGGWQGVSPCPPPSHPPLPPLAGQQQQ